MATQVEALLPGNPLAKAEEHGKVIRGEPVEVGEEEEEEEQQRAKRQRGAADSSAEMGGTTGGEEQTSTRTAELQEDGCDSEDKPGEEGVKGRKEFTDAPPPKVNPWTKKMNAVTVVSVNGQPHSDCLLGSVAGPASGLGGGSVIGTLR